MHMPTLDQLVSRVVERKGYAVQGADEGALLARKDDERLLVAWSPKASVSIADASMYLAAMEQIGATSGVLIAPLGIDQNARDLLAAKETVEVWPESRLVIEAGEAVVKDAIESFKAGPQPAAGPAAPRATAAAAAATYLPRTPTPTASLIGRAIASTGRPHDPGTVMFMPSKPTRQVAGGSQAAIPQKNGALGYAWGGMGGTTSNGIAMVRNGRRRTEEAPAISATPIPDASTGLAAIAENDDVELITTPRKPRRAPEAPAAPAKPIIEADEMDIEIMTTPRNRGRRMNGAAATAAVATPVAEPAAPEPVAAPAAPAPTSLSATFAPSLEAAVAATSAPAAETGATNALRIRVPREDAFARAGVSGGASVKLALVPHIAFNYDLHMERPGMVAPVTAKGTILVSSVTGELRVADALERAASEPADARKDAERLHAVDVYDRVKAHMTKTYTKMVNTERELAGNTVMETVKLTPDQNEMGLDHKGVVYVPVWETSGAEGPVRVCGYTGDRLQ